LNYFSQSKGERDNKSLNRTDSEARFDEGTTSGKYSPEMVSVLGHGMLITGNIVCAGAVKISGRVVGDIHAANLVICEGARVEGNVIAQEMVIHGVFKGSIHGDSVTLRSTAMVDGEIFNKALTIEQNAQFEGVSRRLEKPVDPPSSDHARGEKPVSVSRAEVVPISGAVG
jgi:cytoskeletal protein CcmA (bactofilin family)